MADFESSMERLNDAQRAAVEHIDGPLIVIAGPGTGKTQLLSLRAANILRHRDVQPRNILCLTYTDAGARAMRKRLIELIGRDGYGIEVSTFHAFASSCRSRYPEYFGGGSAMDVVSDLHAKEILDAILKALPIGNALSGVYGGVASNIGKASSFISNMKRQGLTPDEYRAIMRQNLQAAEYLEGCKGFMEFLSASIPGKNEKQEFVDRFEEEVLFACSHAPEGLTANVIGTSGVYVPFVTWLRDLVVSTELVSGNSAKGFTNVRDAISKKDDSGKKVLKLRKGSEAGLAAADVYEAYSARLEAEGLRDYDDMITGFVSAVRHNAEFRYLLQERYRYIQVDEFQDTNGAQMSIVELLCEGLDSPNVMAVGDDDQAIMRFQGASIACIGQFRQRFSPASVVLQTNYRSTPEIVRLGQDIAVQIERRLPESRTDKEIRAHRGSGEQTSFSETVFKSTDLEYLSLARDIRRRIDEGFIENASDPDEAIAVIACKHDSLRALIPYLKAQNVPFAYVQTSNIFSLEPMQTTLALLRFVVANASGRRKLANSLLPQIIASPEFGGDGESSVRFALFAKKEHCGDWLAALAATDGARLSTLYADLLEWSAAAPAAPVRDLMFDITARSRRFYAAKAEMDPMAFAEYNAGLRALLAFTEGELGTASAMGRTMRLTDVVERLDRAQRYGVGIDASVNLGRTGAVTLTTAHSSKGLEFDLVYLIDAEQRVWHKGGGGGVNLYTPNLLIGDEKDEDDARRLLFVAVTRAKDLLEIYRAGASAVQELSEIVETREAEPRPDDLSQAIEVSWRDAYALDTPELKALLAPNLPPRALSASALNLFVAYTEGEETGAARFPLERIVGLPEAPQIPLEYGEAVHGYLEDYVNEILKAGRDDAAQIAERYRRRVETMDFAEEDVERCVRRFDRVVGKMAPWLDACVDGFRLETEVELTAVADGGVPLYGKCDLLLVDDDAKAIRVVDYKTGFGYPEGVPDRRYQRQLQFYRLLIESSAEYAGYRVVSCENWYVEPARDTGELHRPIATSVRDEDIVHLTRLVNAAWHRIEHGLFDTSAFEESEAKAQAIVNLGEKCNKKERERALQIAYELWLVEQDDARNR